MVAAGSKNEITKKLFFFSLVHDRRNNAKYIGYPNFTLPRVFNMVIMYQR